HYKRIDAPADLDKKSRLSKLSERDISATKLAGESISKIETKAASGGSLGGLKVSTENSWFAARPSGTENVYKIYAESFNGSGHLEEVLSEAQSIVDSVVSG
ncbi:MAG: phosphoglucomutase, alpha-D-glucose phosphate-specific, partial [Aquiluna sp.]